MVVTESDKSESLSAVVISRAIQERILSGDYYPGQQLPTERELQLEFGCSRPTVAKAMAPLVANGLIRRSRGKGTFVQDRTEDQSDGTTDATRPNLVTFVSPGHTGQEVFFRHGVLEAIHEVMDLAGYSVGIDFYSNHQQHLRCLSKAYQDRQAGMVVWPEPGQETANMIRQLQEKGFPLVFLDTYLPDLECDFVVTDNITGSSNIVRHLVELGHRRISYLTVRSSRTSIRDRTTGFLRGMVEHDLPVVADTVVKIDASANACKVDPDDLHRVLKQLFASPDRPTALMVSNDWLALEVHNQLEMIGISVPGEVSLAGFDDIEAASSHRLPLTTVRQDYFELGRIAAQILLERLQGKPVQVRYQKFITPTMQIRQSTARLS